MTISSPKIVSPDITPGPLKNKYRFIRQIGQGTQGKVFLAKRLSDQMQVAIKQLNIESVKTWKEYELFHREADILSKLNMDGVVQFIEAIDCMEENPPCSFIVQQYIHGSSIADMFKSGRHLSLNQTYNILLQLVDILEALHSHVPPIIHRDIKPSNILLQPTETDQYKVYLIDFGAVANPQIQSGGSTVAGTFGYMPPEQLMGKPVPASDIYSLAAVAVYMFSGKSPADMPVKDFRLIFEPDLQNMPTPLVDTLRLMLDPVAANRLVLYDVIRSRFRRFMLANYQSNDNVDVRKISHERYDEQLWNVASICEAGNLDLWQALSDQTPRNVPLAYLNAKPNVKNKPQTARYEGKTDVPVYTGILIATFIFASILTFGLLNFFSSHGYFKFVFSVLTIGWAPFLICCRVMSPIDVFIFYYDKRHKKDANYFISELSQASSSQKREALTEELQNHPDYSKVKPHLLAQRKYTELLKNGRKTIATITDVQYIPANKDYITMKMLKSKVKTMHFSSRHIFLDYPHFRILYKFNPPDDEKEEDLYREYITYIEPEGHYEPGMPLPILYQIYRDSHGLEHVDSMPFPIPLHDLYRYDYVVDISNQNNKKAIQTSPAIQRKYDPFVGKRNEQALAEIKQRAIDDYKTVRQEIREDEREQRLKHSGNRYIL